MPRKARICRQNYLHHILFRGVNGEPIYIDDKDRVRFCLLLQEASETHAFNIHGFCFMSNHLHLLLEPHTNTLQKGIHAFSFRYAQYFNRRYKRRGYLFQGRYKSILVEDGDYSKRLIRYIHLNPVEANLVKKPEYYKWSSYRSYLGQDLYTWLRTDRVLKLFDITTECAIKQFIEHTHNKLDKDLSLYEIAKSFRSGTLGSHSLSAEQIERVEPTKDIQNYVVKQEITLDEVLKRLCDYFQVSIGEISSPTKSKAAVDARSAIAFIAKKTNNWSFEQLAQLLNKNSGTLSRLASRAENQPELLDLLNSHKFFTG